MPKPRTFDPRVATLYVRRARGAKRRGRAGACLAVVLALSLGLAAIASAAAPLKGRVYVGSGGDGPALFQVSADGKSLSNFFVGHFDAGACQSNVVGKLPTAGKIENGHFTIKYSQNRVSATFRGEFLAHGRAQGSSVFFWPSPFGSGGCQKKFSWTAKALPAGNKLCANHIGPPHKTAEGGPIGAEAVEQQIVVDGVSCKKAYKVLDAGKFHMKNGNLSAFTTKGWTCRQGTAAGSGQNYKCHRSKPKASLEFEQTGDPCNLNMSGTKPGPQCRTTPAADVRRQA